MLRLAPTRSLWLDRGVWEVSFALIDLNAKRQAVLSTEEARYENLQNVGPNEALSVSLARATHDAAHRPHGPYSHLVFTNDRLRAFKDWSNAKGSRKRCWTISNNSIVKSVLRPALCFPTDEIPA